MKAINIELKEGMLVTDIIPNGALKPVYFTVVKIDEDTVFMKHTDHPFGATKEESNYVGCEKEDGLIPFSLGHEWYLVEMVFSRRR